MRTHHARRPLLALALPMLAACGGVSGEIVSPVASAVARADIAAALGYELVTLETPGGVGGGANDINARGTIVGSVVFASGDEHAARWDDGVMQDLGTLPGDWLSVALGINEAGTIVGYSYGAAGIRAVAWRQGVITLLSISPSAGFAHAEAISSSGIVVGDGWRDLFSNHAFTWNRGAAAFIGSSAIDDASTAVGVNARGDVVGWVFNGGNPHATIWRDGVRTLLPKLGGHERSQAFGINASGKIVGMSGVRDANYELTTRAVLWDGGAAIDLGSPGGTEAAAADINEKGQIVGEGRDATGQVIAWIWERGVMSALPIPVASSAIASSINRRGDVVGRLDRTFVGVPVLWRRTP